MLITDVFFFSLSKCFCCRINRSKQIHMIVVYLPVRYCVVALTYKLVILNETLFYLKVCFISHF